MARATTSLFGVVAVVCLATVAVADEALFPPEPVTRTEAVYPAAEATRTAPVEVVVQVALGADGKLTEATITQSGGAAFDAAALEAIRAWTWKPARRGERPIASRLKVPFTFAPAPNPNPSPNPGPNPNPSPSPNPNPNPSPSPNPNPNPNPGPNPNPSPNAVPAPVPVPAAATDSPDADALDVTIRGHKRLPPRATSDFVYDQKTLSLAPHQSASDLLVTAPGVYVARPEGEAVAHEIFLRGFDAEHGQDMELSLGIVPLNQPSHLHGQGYGDLNFIIPEVVRSLRVTEGTYDPRQGDFAVAGSIDFDLGVRERGIRIASSGGSFRTVRQLVLWAPLNQPEETFAAFQLRNTAGFGENRGALSASAIGQVSLPLPKSLRGTLQLVAAGARGSLAGVVRRDDVAAGRVGFYDTYNDPSATAQSAFSLRTHLAASFEHTDAAGAQTTFGLWLAFTQYRSRENYTGYRERSRINPDWLGRGDLIEQENRDIGLGGEVTYKTRRLRPSSIIDGLFAFGLRLRSDFIDQGQNLLEQPQNETWDRRVDASVRQADLGVFADLDWRFTRYFRVRGGVRADVLYFDVDDRLGNFIPRFAAQTHLVGFRRTAIGVAWGPRLTLEGTPLPWLQLLFSYGEGFRSPAARLLEEGENAPFAKVRSVEGGLRAHLPDAKGGAQKLAVSLAAYATFLNRDLAFDPGEGSLTIIGPSSRKGFVVNLESRPLSWLTANASLTYARATLDAPPPPTAAIPSPPYKAGDLLPYVPAVVFRADLGADHRIGRLAGLPVDGKLGVGLSVLGPRPLPYGDQSPAFALLDLRAQVRWSILELGLDLMNVANQRYAASEYSFVSDWGNRTYPSALPARHIAAGAPFTALFTVALNFGGER